MSGMLDGLRELARTRAIRPAREIPPPRPRPAPAPVPELEGSCLRVVKPVPHLVWPLSEALTSLAARDPEAVDKALVPAVGATLSDIAVVDLETLGFWGCPIFLVGMLIHDGSRLVTVQLLARDYPEEEAILQETADLLGERRVLITFNGKSYDAPCFRERAAYHGVRHRLDDLVHVDLLHPARRRFKAELPDCRLVTLEREVVGTYRHGDVPSHEIPALYHRYAATGDPSMLTPVLHHSREDVLTTAQLFAELAR